MNVDVEKLRLATHQSVRANKFTKVNGQPTWQQWRNWCEEAEDEAITVHVSYEWAGDHGLLARLIVNHAYKNETDKNYVPPMRPPPIPEC